MENTGHDCRPQMYVWVLSCCALLPYTYVRPLLSLSGKRLVPLLMDVPVYVRPVAGGSEVPRYRSRILFGGKRRYQ